MSCPTCERPTANPCKPLPFDLTEQGDACAESPECGELCAGNGASTLAGGTGILGQQVGDSLTMYPNAEQVYTASCPSGESGSPVTVTVLANTVFSLASLSDANDRALALAVKTAEEAIVCS